MTLSEFLNEWHNDSPTIRVKTSGSTGVPKTMLAEKKRMEASARMTCDFLNLRSGDKALLCLPLDYIAGKMMVVRSLVRKLQLISIQPSRHPFANLSEAPDFVAMTPMQVASTFEIPDEMRIFRKTKHVIIGGGSIDAILEKKLMECPNAVWSTYGMTETLSHIALRRISGENATSWYSPLPGIEVSLSERSTLCIDASMLHDGILETNDIVELDASNGQFRILGRTDNVINSGGVKIQIEEVEERLHALCPSVQFMLTSCPDSILGEKCVLLIQKSTDEMAKKKIIHSIGELPRYWRPKSIVTIDALPMTETGKPNRAAAKALAIDSVQEPL